MLIANHHAADKIRVMDNEDVKPLITPSLGTHVCCRRFVRLAAAAVVRWEPRGSNDTGAPDRIAELLLACRGQELVHHSIERWQGAVLDAMEGRDARWHDRRRAAPARVRSSSTRARRRLYSARACAVSHDPGRAARRAICVVLCALAHGARCNPLDADHCQWLRRTGIRPLVREGSLAGTASISRSHLLEISPSRLITITGGKWTTYRYEHC